MAIARPPTDWRQSGRRDWIHSAGYRDRLAPIRDDLLRTRPHPSSNGARSLLWRHAGAPRAGNSSPPLAVMTAPPQAEVRPRVLVVDDEPSIREVQRRLLARANIDAVLASNGAEARHILLTESVDLVVSDVRMPGDMDGFALYAWIAKERPELARRVILATGDIGGSDAQAITLPADQILRKPFQGDEFLRCVRAALARP
jgi:CheY-like chemotaxis protein